MVRDLQKSAAREARVAAVVILMAISYLAGSANTDCWGLIMAPHAEGAK